MYKNNFIRTGADWKKSEFAHTPPRRNNGQGRWSLSLSTRPKSPSTTDNRAVQIHTHTCTWHNRRDAFVADTYIIYITAVKRGIWCSVCVRADLQHPLVTPPRPRGVDRFGGGAPLMICTHVRCIVRYLSFRVRRRFITRTRIIRMDRGTPPPNAAAY